MSNNTIITIPQNLNYETLFGVTTNLKDCSLGCNLILDFSCTTFITPGGITPILTYLLQHKTDFNELTINSNKASQVDDCLIKMGFYKLLNINSSNEHITQNDIIPFQELYNFNSSTDETEVGECKERIMSVFTRNSNNDKLVNAINWCIPELVDNAHIHSYSDNCVLFAQRNKGFTEFCIADTGIGIKESTGEETIDIALNNCIKEKYKGKSSKGYGNGLFYTSELIKTDSILNKCKLVIYSEVAILVLNSGKTHKIFTNKPFWNGTVVTLIIDDNIQKNISDLLGRTPYGIEDLEDYDDIF